MRQPIGYQAAFHSSGFRAGQGLARAMLARATARATITRAREEKDSEGEFAQLSSRRPIRDRRARPAEFFARIVTGDNYSYHSLLLLIRVNCQQLPAGIMARCSEEISADRPRLRENPDGGIYHSPILQADHSGCSGHKCLIVSLLHACSLKRPKVPVFVGPIVTRWRPRRTRKMEFLVITFSLESLPKVLLFDEPRTGAALPVPPFPPFFLLQFAIIADARLQPLRGYDKDFKVSPAYLLSLQLSRTLIFSTTSALSPSLTFRH